ncbi:alcohol dehydrogenase catalytic domain-containing protein [Streptomyces ipomoeae]|jgi:alcohol dehydrogenase|uniref:Oxidoreductase, zinc-binding dehydrogenase family protein n=1 Tax=Streptomyces ipomoeae 91-03 TaxID=698759 RepID=L1KS89_9ACTN|nr:alcohol dehydrogenase catalytic domain-containing protein [Streptomyces ipomoeae]EKX63671.1 oxidoreductase, zinc-binding dehydrogenase family protein [Streptomyces ipomoeae 91-03]MDX2692598.1 alcohol dehydrogenase catalytic domain-containing protein [Streptomyces ipomoeae]MDX2819540.1 alcohol dehydrogenase catalytic domain-containing protein [Streptomyces ipomoeae]MDX2840818.1 alcohol dehydrogenase catalytic domain-containing protein [Streptomyces ipomoeae]MDX2873331.1 alcohol dehydrogenase
MRELTYVARDTVEWREAPDPKLQSDQEAIVAPVAATSCDVDTAILAGHGFLDPPFALGHECVARVVEAGDAVTAVSPGDLVVVPWSINCGTCDKCRAGLTAHCSAVPYMAMYGAPIGGDWGGLFSDLVRVPWADAMLVPLPADLDPVAMASASDNWSLSWRLVAPHLKARPGARVLVVARGSIGLYVCDIARALGASDVLYVDPDPEHRELAEGFGARTAESVDPVPPGFDIAVEATGRVDQLAAALKRLAPEGICESAGNHFRPGELPLLDMYLTGVTLRIARDNVRSHIPDALGLARSGDVDPRRVVSHVLDWEQLPEALPEKHLKPVFVRATE